MQPLKSSRAWQPLTPRGVAGLAREPLRRLLLVQFVFAVMTAASVVWFLHTAWFPTIGAAIRRLPAKGEIRSGRLTAAAGAPVLLAEGYFLAIVLDPTHTGGVRSTAHLQVEFGTTGVRCISLMGYADWDYPETGWLVAFNRPELEPWWGAWGPPVLWITFVVVVVGLPLLWALWSTAWFLLVWLVGFFANRNLTFWQCWKLSGAACLPGALVLCAAIFCYGFRLLDLVQLSAAGTAQFVVGAMYCLASPFFAPKLSSAEAGGNPFARG